MKKLLIILFALLGCTKPKSNIYTVKAGHNYCNHRRLVIIKENLIRFSFEVNDTWQWDYGKTLSKVCGLAWGDPKKKSIRLAVRSTIDGSALYAFAHVDGEIKSHYLTTVKNGTYHCVIWYDNDNFMLIVNEKFALIPAKTGLKKAEMCWPYIGGNYVINHNWVVPLEFY